MVLPPFTFGQGTSEIFSISQISIIVISLVLMGISITAYRNTSLKKVMLAVIIFGLFALQHIVNYLDAQVADIMPDDIRFTFFSGITLAIILLFFFVVVRK